MAEKAVVKTDPKEHSARQKWQEEVSSQLNADAINGAMMVNQMKIHFLDHIEFLI